MKMNKIIVSAFVAMAMAAMAATSVSAVDYGGTPSYTITTGTTTTTTSGEVAGTTADTAVATVKDSTIEAALKGDNTVYVEGNASVKEAAIAAIAAQDEPVVFVGEDYTVCIDPATITEVKAIKVGMTVEQKADQVVITPAANGDFGMTFTVTVNVDADIENAHLFYVSDKNKTTDLGAVEIVDGTATIEITHASYYVIAEGEADVEEDDDNGAVIDDEDEDDVAVEDGDVDGEVTVVVTTPADDANPGTGVSLVFGAAAVSAAALALTSKKRK